MSLNSIGFIREDPWRLFRITRCPMILVGRQFWSGLLKWMTISLAGKRQFIGPGDMDSVTLTEDPEHNSQPLRVSIVKPCAH
jgi:predicted Rossmann-fold nucleotide-binding protein